MAKLNCVLGGKGGVGKSIVANLLAQYHIGQGHSVHCFDTDSKHWSLSKYDALNAVMANIMDGDQIDLDGMNTWITAMMNFDEDDICVIDCGTFNFVTLVLELESMDFLKLCSEMDDQMIIHAVLMQGPDIETQLEELQELLERFQGAEFVVWKNEHFQPISLNGSDLEQSRLFVDHRETLNKIITIPHQSCARTARILADVYNSHMTFDEVLGTSRIPIYSRSIIHRYWKRLQGEIKQAITHVQESAPPPHLSEYPGHQQPTSPPDVPTGP